MWYNPTVYHTLSSLSQCPVLYYSYHGTMWDYVVKSPCVPHTIYPVLYYSYHGTMRDYVVQSHCVPHTILSQCPVLYYFKHGTMWGIIPHVQSHYKRHRHKTLSIITFTWFSFMCVIMKQIQNDTKKVYYNINKTTLYKLL